MLFQKSLSGRSTSPGPSVAVIPYTVLHLETSGCTVTVATSDTFCFDLLRVCDRPGVGPS